MDNIEKKYKFKRMAGSTNAFVLGMAFLGFSALSIWVAFKTLAASEMDGILVLLLGFAFLTIALCWTCPYLQHLVFTETSIQVFLGPIKVQEMRAEDIHTFLYAAVNISVRGAGEDTEVPIIVLSTRSSDYLKMMYRRFANKEVQQQVFRDEQEEEEFILQYAIDTHIGNEGRNFRLPKEEGVWMEYTPERFRVLKEMYPHAEDCAS